MAAITKVDPAPLSVGNEFNDAGYAAVAFTAGDPVIITGAAPPSRKWDATIGAATTEAHGVALKDCAVGGTVEYGIVGEMDGFSGLTPGAPLTVVGGSIDTTAPGAGVAVRIRAVTPSRIRYNLV